MIEIFSAEVGFKVGGGHQLAKDRHIWLIEYNSPGSLLRLHLYSLQTQRRIANNAELNAPVSGGGLLGSPPVELDLVYCPHCPLDVLQAHKALVETEVVSDGVLEASGGQ